MTEYVYGFQLVIEDDEVFFRFPKLPQILSTLSLTDFGQMETEAVADHAHDAVVSALQACIGGREPLPEVDDPALVQADGFVRLSPLEAMKLELYRIYQANCSSMADFARRLSKGETAVRRLLDLRHRSWTREVEAAIEHFGKKLVHRWEIEVARHSLADARRTVLAAC